MPSDKSPPFTSEEWLRIREMLADDPVSFGLPQRIYGSVVLGSFNIRKLGSLHSTARHRRDSKAMAFLADICRHFDLLAIQEVMRDTEGIRELKQMMGPEYGLVLSDTTGALPGGGGGMPERSAFIYNRSVVRRTELVTDVTYDRFEVLDTLVREFPRIATEINSYRQALSEVEAARLAGSKRGRRPTLKMPGFLAFARTPFAVGFQVQGFPGSERYEFLAVCAHLFYGSSIEDRRREGTALIRWMMGKARESGENGTNLVLFGDLNLDYDNPVNDLARIEATVEQENRKSKRRVQMSFPFLFPHPQTRQLAQRDEVFRTNVLLSQTYDQIGILTTDDRLKNRLATTAQGHAMPEVWGVSPEGPDYGVFNLSELFARSLVEMPFAMLGTSEKKRFLRRFDFRISDHLPIWYRFPLPTLPKGVNIPAAP